MLADLANAAFDQVAHVKRARRVRKHDGLALVSEDRIAGDNIDAGKLGEIGDQVFGDAVGNIVLLRIAAEIGKWQDRDRGALRRGKVSPFELPRKGSENDQQRRNPDPRQDHGARTRPTEPCGHLPALPASR